MPHASHHLLDVMGFIVGIFAICIGIYLRTLSYHDYPTIFPAGFAIVGWVLILMNIEPFFADPYVPTVARFWAYVLLSAAIVYGCLYIYKNHQIATPQDTFDKAINGNHDDTDDGPNA